MKNWARAIYEYIRDIGINPTADLMTDNNGPNRRIRVDVGQTGFFAGRTFRISHEMTVTTTPVVLRFSSPVDFVLYSQRLECDQGGIRFRAYRSNQGTPGGTFDTPIDIWDNNGMDEAPAYDNQVSIDTGGTFTPGVGVNAAETIRLVSNPGGAGPTAGTRNTVGDNVAGERGLPAGDYYLVFERPSGMSVDGTGVYNLLWEERP